MSEQLGGPDPSGESLVTFDDEGHEFRQPIAEIREQLFGEYGWTDAMTIINDGDQGDNNGHSN